MKRILPWASFLLFLIIICAVNISIVNYKTDKILEPLYLSRDYALNEDENKARDALEEANKLWDANSTYMCSVLRHSETDEIFTAFKTAFGALDAKDFEDFQCHCSELISHIELIQETERFSFANFM